ncbi:MAG: hypothetical protein AAF065_01695 [Verrucomicrobiota bacterium]
MKAEPFLILSLLCFLTIPIVGQISGIETSGESSMEGYLALRQQYELENQAALAEIEKSLRQNSANVGDTISILDPFPSNPFPNDPPENDPPDDDPPDGDNPIGGNDGAIRPLIIQVDSGLGALGTQPQASLEDSFNAAAEAALQEALTEGE